MNMRDENSSTEQNHTVEFNEMRFSSVAEYRRINILLMKMDSDKAERIAKRHGWKLHRRDEDER